MKKSKLYMFVILLSLAMLLPMTSQAQNTQTYKKAEIIKYLSDNKLISPGIKEMDKHNQEQALCLSLNMYHEARGSTVYDQIATSYVVLNRLKNKTYPLHTKNPTPTICDIIFDKWQFCWTNNNLISKPSEKVPWELAQQLAIEILSNPKHIELAQQFKIKHYVATPLLQDSSRPKWIDRRQLTVSIGKHSYLSISENILHNKINLQKYQSIIHKGYNLIFPK